MQENESKAVAVTDSLIVHEAWSEAEGDVFYFIYDLCAHILFLNSIDKVGNCFLLFCLNEIRFLFNKTPGNT